MSIFFIKSILSLIVILFTVINMFTMFEIFGREERKYNIETLKKIHRIGGILYFIVFAVVTYFCLKFIFMTKTELSVRATFHGVFALAILVLSGVKILYVRKYRQFYNHTKVVGLLISLITFGMIGTSAGYYLLVSEFGTEKSYDRIIQYKEEFARQKPGKKAVVPMVTAKTEAASIGNGKNIFDAKCKFCHNAYNTETLVGPGLKGILKNMLLPVSKRPATPENLRRQLIHPFSRMPSFEYLSEEEMEDITAFLNTL